MRYLGYLVLLEVAIVAMAMFKTLLFQVVSPTVQQEPDGLAVRSAAAARSIPPGLLLNSEQQGKVTLLSNGREISDTQLRRYLHRSSGVPPSSTTYWKFGAPHTVTASASGIDREHYFVNSYLVGFEPFAVDSLWQPLYTVATRKRYQLDSEQYGLQEIWQNSAQAYLNTRGDCEDHALLLADWLIAEGVDARVVLGKYKGGGHAWVVAMREGKTFLLEATSKRRYRNWNAYPLAMLSQGYEPAVMFNRDSFWVNTGSHLSSDYSGSQWVRSSHYQAVRTGADGKGV